MLEAYETMGEVVVLTTFHKEGLDLYGQRFLNSFAERVDKRVKLLVYAEDCVVQNPDPSQITVYDAKLELPKLNAFKDKWKHDPRANGIPPDEIKARRPKITQSLNGTLLDLLIKLMLYMTLVKNITING